MFQVPFDIDKFIEDNFKDGQDTEIKDFGILVSNKTPTSKRLRNYQFDHKQLRQIKDEQTFDNILKDVKSMFKGQNYNEVMKMLADRYKMTDTNAALIDFLDSEANWTSVLNDINKKGR